VTALLDTHAIIWAGQTPHRLGVKARAALSNPESVLLVSAASAWEIATKVRLGKLTDAAELEADFVTLIVGAGFKLLPISTEDALRAGRLPGAHRDPWDRMIAAQALALDIPVISIDEKLDVFGARRIW
jgi:PIN domain nuclease of toxin-antitoxin system